MSQGLSAATGSSRANVIEAASVAESRSTCEECGYDLRGLSADRPCPECGHASDGNGTTAAGRTTRVAAGTVWTVSVAAGLSLLLLLTLDGVATVLVQPFDEAVGGTLPSLNLPGPKLWAVPLLQRPIGNTPELPGVTGTRTAMLSLLAVWLITARPPRDDTGGRDPQALRLAARWGCLVAFGMAFGVLLARQGLWPSELPPYRVLLVCGAELPGAVLLYLYLRQLASRLPGAERRRAFDHLAWAAPGVVAAGGLLVVIAWLMPDGKALAAPSANLPLSIGYGTLALCAGVASSAAVASLAGSFGLLAFPNLWRTTLGTGRWIRAVGGGMAASSDAAHRRLAAAAMVAGLVLLPVVMVIGLDRVGWYTARRGVAGNLPFYNYPGPKLWAAAAVPELGQRDWWNSIAARAVLTALNLAAFWLVTVDPGRDTPIAPARGEGALRRLTRWLPVLAVGAALGCASMASEPSRYYDRVELQNRTKFFAAVTVACELPATVLLYAYLGLLARRLGRGELAGRFAVLAVLVVMLVGVGLSALVLSRRLQGAHTDGLADAVIQARHSPALLAAAGAYGAMALAVATWAVVSMLSLARTIFARRMVSP